MIMMYQVTSEERVKDMEVEWILVTIQFIMLACFEEEGDRRPPVVILRE
jgi:hypothetical protein